MHFLIPADSRIFNFKINGTNRTPVNLIYRIKRYNFTSVNTTNAGQTIKSNSRPVAISVVSGLLPVGGVPGWECRNFANVLLLLCPLVVTRI